MEGVKLNNSSLSVLLYFILFIVQQIPGHFPFLPILIPLKNDCFFFFVKN